MKAGTFFLETKEMKERIAIQGFEGSFHEIAAIKFFGADIVTYECDTFQKLFESFEKGKAKYAVCAIENSVAGSILPNYARLRESNLEIFGEVYLRIEMNLMALKGQKLSDIEEVHSHPMAILQCTDFFRKHPSIQLIESKDTALSAMEIKEHHIKGRGALGSEAAANLYGLEILGKSIETNKRNFTRFLVLKQRKDPLPFEKGIINKASISFLASHKPGSLAKALTIMGEFGMNLTKIQSLPILGKEWTYFMYADLEFDHLTQFEEMVKVLEPVVFEFVILGEYTQAIKIN